MSRLSELMLHGREQNLLYSVLIELTYRCNLDCYFCYNDLSLHGRRMRFDDHVRLLDDLAGMQVMGVSFSGGEPLAYPQFFELATHARQRGFVITIKTNGHRVNQRIAGRIAAEIDPFLVETSLHGACAETHDRQTRVPGSFERLLRHLEAMKDAGLRVRLNSTLTAWNESEVEDMYRLADQLGLPLQFDAEVSPRDDGDREPLAIGASDEGLRRMMRIGMRRAAANSSTASIPLRMPATAGVPKASRVKNCGAGSTSVAVDPFGNVYPCVQWRQRIGNLHEHSIAEIWSQSTELDEIRDTTVEALRVRQANQLSGFCPGLAKLTTGSPLKVYPGAQRKARLTREVLEESQS